jgi:hypothetical protein
MRASLDTAGERVSFDCALPWVGELVAEGTGGELVDAPAAAATVAVHVEAGGCAFTTPESVLVARGVWRHGDAVVMENVCTTGFDLRLQSTPERFEFTYRWRPAVRERVTARALRSRFHLLVRCALLQYPVMWAAGTRGRAPLHASACLVGRFRPLVAAAGGIGRSTILVQETRSGGRTTGDNLAVADGTTVWGLVEPVRVAGGSGRRMPHGRRESPLPQRLRSVVPDCLLVLERSRREQSTLVPRASGPTARSLITSTYMAGELRRYWPFAAALAAATGQGPAHPPIAEVSSAFSAKLPCFTLALGETARPDLAELLGSVEIAA